MPARCTYQQGGWIDFKVYAADSCLSVLGVNSKNGMLKADPLILIGRIEIGAGPLENSYWSIQASLFSSGAAAKHESNNQQKSKTNRSNRIKIKLN